ncbi:hypothetical protein ACFE6N_08020 [Pedobacter sp. BG31]|uniref:hypothetical protein n=1 Tax=Pedobacter sp. BG31 TaxID=3349697 RepID=UPI0035F33122
MKIITDIKEANILLQSYTGGTLQIAFYSESLKRIAIRISLPAVKEIIYFVGVGCESISGNFRILNVNLSIAQKIDESTKENILKIRDKLSGFELSTSRSFSLAQGLESEFGDFFDHFIKEKE